MRASVFTLRDPELGRDALYLAQHLRERDTTEVLAVAESVIDSIDAAIMASPICAVACIGDRPVFVIGCAPLPEREGMGVPWLLATDEVTAHRGALTKITKHYVGLFLERWPALLNYVDQRNTDSVRWLQRLGFTIGEPVAFGRQGEPFHPFTMGL
ncbi:hypothetical protein UFOVP1324_4 [uncultured Caudovirales phage]|uniref:DUF2833 domain-containing protein n=1 Tax=uncultured Caudovirales phage TaxID=2100421 RepID=A0A6J5RWR4_9CAUD|nr:hypothetical protein UFOVP1324_4 [uncultured Caudovirales phage]